LPTYCLTNNLTIRIYVDSKYIILLRYEEYRKKDYDEQKE